MKNLFSKKALAEARFNELFNHLFAGMVIGCFSGGLLFMMNPAKEKDTIVYIGITIGIASILSLIATKNKPAAAAFACTLPIITALVCVRLGINTQLPYTDNLLLFSRGFFPILLVGAILFKLDRWGTKIIQEDKGYGGMPTPPFE